ncbi:hypothetical protein L210DRAFT_3535754 [Boletus edulis BED1]|uniref:BRCT domain-containing protein n=1 Tax=Boletus edulis BED1 TaxID=1328754 RepID=A0AAD4BXJ4_BOLED|nr:hypothetical protein L210DRAFT_3535754 [Boletus edulis BED1]
MRRRNKSHKVPNVKLRPAQAHPRPSRPHEPDAFCDRSSDSEIPPNASIADLCPRPFKGFTICATGTMDKPTLFKMAFELGATSTSDFTDRVTHLIANLHGGAKYMCALERKIPIMTLDWVTEAHAIWLHGDDVDVEQSVSNHRLPIFSGVVLSLSGIEDIHRRTEINRLVTAHQGAYLKNLERPVRVTHILCSGDTETDKMKYAKKFNKRKEAHIHLVWEEWFWDCLEFGGRFDERKYQVSRPRPERKSLHEIPIPSIHVQDSAPGSHPNSAIPVDDVDPPKRLKPVVPAGSFTVISNLQIDGEEEEMAMVDKPVPAVTLQLWQSLLKPRGFELDGGKLVRSPSKSQATRSPPSTPTRHRAQSNAGNRNGARVEHGKEREKESVISSFRRAHSFAPVPVKEPAIRQPFRRNTACPVVCSGEAEGSGLHKTVQPGESAIPTLFAGYTFRLLGEARCTNVRLAIENGGGIVVDDDAEEPNFIIVRLISGTKLYHDEFDDNVRTKYRTECWLEHSVFHERICEPDENVSFTPLKIATPVPDAETVHLSLSGLDQSELCWIRRLVRAVGITLESTFSRRSTHLLCPGGTGAKFDKAVEWRIPVVPLSWLEHIGQSGTIPPVDDYFIGGSHAGATIDGIRFLDPIPEVKRDKGKGKEKEVDYHMMDITNDDSTKPMFVKNATLLQDTSPRNWESNARRHCDKRLEEPRSPPCNGLFGKPKFLMHDSDPPEEAEANGNNFTTSSPPAAPPLSSSPPPVEADLPLFEPTPPVAGEPARSIDDAHVKAKADIPAQAQAQPHSHAPTQSQTQASTPAQARVPSSTSPSPIKLLPSSSIPNAFAPSSPARLPDTTAITKALHESLTSLLGKRSIVEYDRDEAIRDAGGAGVRAAKKGKRVRPGGPSNVPSRNASRENVISPQRPLIPPPLVPPPDLEVNMSLLDGFGMDAMRSTEESLRVTYEDPGQAEEKRRLLRMLGGDEQEVGVIRGVTGAVSTRISEVGRVRRTKRGKGLRS